MQIETWPIDKFIEYEKNPRKNNHVVDKMAKFIKEYGFKVPIIAKSDGSVIDGHLRLKAARKLKLKNLPVLLADDLTDVQIKAFRLAINKSAELASWDEELLAVELQDLVELGADVELAGFSAEELIGIIGEPENEGLTGDDDVPDVPEEPVCKLGDLWILGEHRVLCGDSTDAGQVERLMNGQKADFVFTDPPYGISLGFESPEQAKARNRRVDGLVVKNDDLHSDDLIDLLIGSFSSMDANLKEGGAFYVCSPIGKEVRKFIQAIETVDWHYQSGLVWNKSSLSLSRHDYHPKHEIIHYGWKKGAAHTWVADRKQTSVFDFDKPSKSVDHPTSKPIGLVSYFIGNVSTVDDLVLDLFFGSGSTLIACEKTNRKCFGMELDEHYCDVILQRWENYSGKKAILESTGQTFKKLKKTRSHYGSQRPTTKKQKNIRSTSTKKPA